MAQPAAADKDCSFRWEGPSDDSGRLSQREKQIVILVSLCKSNREIAKDLGTTASSVKEYLYRIFPKLGVKNRVELALWVWGIRRHYD